jgi:hypothetical protein
MDSLDKKDKTKGKQTNSVRERLNFNPTDREFQISKDKTESKNLEIETKIFKKGDSTFKWENPFITAYSCFSSSPSIKAKVLNWQTRCYIIFFIYFTLVTYAAFAVV